MPGPYTLSGRLRTGPGEVYPERDAAAEAFVPILRAELEGLVDAGATIIQVDEPSPAIHPDAPSDFAALFNAAVAPVRRAGPARARTCASATTWAGRWRARTYRPVLDAMLRFGVDELVLEFANREMAEVESLARDRRRGSRRRGRASSTSRTTTSSRPTRSPSGSTRCSRPASRPSA